MKLTSTLIIIDIKKIEFNNWLLYMPADIERIYLVTLNLFIKFLNKEVKKFILLIYSKLNGDISTS